MATRIEKIRRINTRIMTPQQQHQQQAWILKPKKGGGGKKKTPTNPLKKRKNPRQTKNNIKNDMNNEVVDNNNNSVNLRHNNQCCCVLQETLQRLRMTRLFWRLLKLIRWDLAYSFNQKRLCLSVCMYVLQSVRTWKERGISVFTALEPNQILTGCLECSLNPLSLYL